MSDAVSSLTNALSITSLSKIYAGGVQALDGVDLEVGEGEMFALLGPNGAGKSTLIGIVTSLVRKSGGRVSVFGVDIDQDHALAKTHIGVVPQEFNCNPFERVRNVLVNQAGYYGVPRRVARIEADRLIERLDLGDKCQVPARQLSGGMKRRLMIARALVHRPRLLILDEPTAGVDIELRRGMWDFLRELHAAGTTIILTTHYLEEAEHLCRNIAIIDEGRIIENTSIRALLRRMNTEVFMLTLDGDLAQPPELPGHDCRLVDPHTLEVAVHRGQSLNSLFAALSEQGVTVVSMRNRNNRLEQLFLQLVRLDEGRLESTRRREADARLAGGGQR